MLDSEATAEKQALELRGHTDSTQLLLASPQQDEATEIAAVHLEDRDLDVLHFAALLEACVVGHHLLEDLARLDLATGARSSKAEEQSEISHPDTCLYRA